MTTNSIIATARRKILESTTDLVTDAVILQYANEEYREIRKKLKMNSEVIKTTIACSNGTCTLPANYGAMYSFAIDSSDSEYEEMSMADYEAGDFERGFTIQAGALLVNVTTLTGLTIRYFPKAAVLTTSQDPEIDEMFHEAIMYGAVSRCQEDLQDEELATYYRAKADAEFEKKVSVQSHYEEGNQRGGQMFSDQQLI